MSKQEISSEGSQKPEAASHEKILFLATDRPRRVRFSARRSTAERFPRALKRTLRALRLATSWFGRVGVLAHHEREMVGEYTHPTRSYRLLFAVIGLILLA